MVYTPYKLSSFFFRLLLAETKRVNAILSVLDLVLHSTMLTSGGVMYTGEPDLEGGWIHLEFGTEPVSGYPAVLGRGSFEC